MTKEERTNKTIELVTELLLLLEGKGLTVSDAAKILLLAKDAIVETTVWVRAQTQPLSAADVLELWTPHLLEREYPMLPSFTKPSP